VVTGKPFARYWVHTAFLRVDGQRMGKSERNFILVRDALREYSPEAIRHFLISAQYRHPLDYNPISLKESTRAIRRLNNCLDALTPYQIDNQRGLDEKALNEAEAALLQSIDAMRDGFEMAMDDDFNTAEAIGVIFKFIGEVNQFLVAAGNQPSEIGKIVLGKAYKSLIDVCSVLGIYSEKRASSDENAIFIEQLMDLILEVRQDARRRKDWETSDNIRDRLKQIHVELQDTRYGTTWKRNP